MKKWLLLLCMAMAVLSGCNALPGVFARDTEPTAEATTAVVTAADVTAATEPTETDGLPPSELFDLDWNDRSVFLSGLTSASQHWAQELPDATLYRVELVLPDALDMLTGRQEIVYTNTEEIPLDDIVLRLFPNVSGGLANIENVRVDGQAVEPEYRFENSTVLLPLNEALEPGDHLFLQFDFSLSIPREMGGNYGLFGYFDNVLMLDLFLPTIPAYDENGWYENLPPRHGDLSYYDASFYLLRVIAPADLVLVTSGVEVEREDNSTQTVIYAAGPARDFSLAASDQFEVQSRMVDEVRVNSYYFPGFEQGGEIALNDAAASIETFSEMIGAYDYTEFDVAATPQLAGGVEYPGMTWINTDYYNLDGNGNIETMVGILRSVVSHEVGHQWFYNVVGNSQVTEPWLDESLVQYINGLYFREEYGTAALKTIEESWYARWSKIDMREMPIGMPSADYNAAQYVASVYGRGPFFFRALSRQMGEDVFLEFLRDYYGRYHWQIATTEEIKALAESHCNCDLTDLFEQWVLP